MKFNSLVKTITYVFLTGTLISLVFLSYRNVYGQDKQPQVNFIGVVNLDKLLKTHKDWAKLVEFDNKLQALKSGAPDAFDVLMQKEANKKFSSLVSEYENRVQLKNEELTSTWTLQQSSVSTQLQAIQHKYARIQDAEVSKIMSKTQKELKILQQQYEDELNSKLGDRVSKIMSKYQPEKDKETQAIKLMLDQYINALVAERDRKAQDKHTSLKLDIQDVCSAEKNRLTSQLEEYKQKRLQENQQQLMEINLQINKLNSKSSFSKEDEEELKKLVGQRDSIDQQYSADIAARSDEIDASFSAFSKKKQAEVEAKLKSYTDELNRDMQSKIEPKKKEFDGVLQSKLSDVQQKINSELKVFKDPIVAEYEGKMKQKQSQIENEAKSKIAVINANISSQFEQERNSLMSQLDSTQGSMKGDMDSFGKQLQKEFELKKKKLEKELSQNSNEALKKRKEKFVALSKDRKKLFEDIMKDISEKAQEVSSEKNISVVLSGYWLNVDSVDLTDDVVKLLSQSK